MSDGENEETEQGMNSLSKQVLALSYVVTSLRDGPVDDLVKKQKYFDEDIKTYKGTIDKTKTKLDVFVDDVSNELDSVKQDIVAIKGSQKTYEPMSKNLQNKLEVQENELAYLRADLVLKENTLLETNQKLEAAIIECSRLNSACEDITNTLGQTHTIIMDKLNVVDSRFLSQSNDIHELHMQCDLLQSIVRTGPQNNPTITVSLDRPRVITFQKGLDPPIQLTCFRDICSIMT